jgi:hypothetical protein
MIKANAAPATLSIPRGKVFNHIHLRERFSSIFIERAA